MNERQWFSMDVAPKDGRLFLAYDLDHIYRLTTWDKHDGVWMEYDNIIYPTVWCPLPKMLDMNKISPSVDNDQSDVIPEFDGKYPEPRYVYTWWSWSRQYPRWTKSCWGGNTIHEAIENIGHERAHQMLKYHNKLIKETVGTLTEVVDLPL